MAEALFPKRWSGGDKGESWELEIEHDCFADDEPFVVSVAFDCDEGRNRQQGLVTPTPEQAREMAVALTCYAFMADQENRRVSVSKREAG